MERVLGFLFSVLLGFQLFAFDCGDMVDNPTIQYKKDNGTTGWLNFYFSDSGVGDGSWEVNGDDNACVYEYHTPTWPYLLDFYPPTVFPSTNQSQVVTVRVTPDLLYRLVYETSNIDNPSMSTTRNKTVYNLDQSSHFHADETNTTYDSHHYYSGTWYHVLNSWPITIQFRVQIWRVSPLPARWVDTNYLIELDQFDSFSW